jgi:hypothetical protein
MAKKDRPWWSKNHTLWGGETFASTQSKPRLGIRSGDKFRVEKGLKNNITLIPHPDNDGTWKDSHSKSNPIRLTAVPGTKNERAFSMMVKISSGAASTELFLIERKNGTIAITEDVTDPGASGGTASVER